jgi:hypothetical protein
MIAPSNSPTDIELDKCSEMSYAPALRSTPARLRSHEYVEQPALSAAAANG